MEALEKLTDLVKIQGALISALQRRYQMHRLMWRSQLVINGLVIIYMIVGLFS